MDFTTVLGIIALAVSIVSLWPGWQQEVHAVKIQYFEDTDTLYIELSLALVDDTYDLDEDTLLEVDAAGRPCAITIEHLRERMAVPAFPYELTPSASPQPA